MLKTIIGTHPRRVQAGSLLNVSRSPQFHSQGKTRPANSPLPTAHQANPPHLPSAIPRVGFTPRAHTRQPVPIPSHPRIRPLPHPPQRSAPVNPPEQAGSQRHIQRNTDGFRPRRRHTPTHNPHRSIGLSFRNPKPFQPRTLIRAQHQPPPTIKPGQPGGAAGAKPTLAVENHGEVSGVGTLTHG